MRDDADRRSRAELAHVLARSVSQTKVGRGRITDREEGIKAADSLLTVRSIAHFPETYTRIIAGTFGFDILL